MGDTGLLWVLLVFVSEALLFSNSYLYANLSLQTS